MEFCPYPVLVVRIQQLPACGYVLRRSRADGEQGLAFLFVHGEWGKSVHPRYRFREGVPLHAEAYVCYLVKHGILMVV